MKLVSELKLLWKSGHHIPLLSVLFYGRFRSFEQRSIAYKRKVVDIQRTMQSYREVSHLRYVENYPLMSSMRGSLQLDNHSTDMLRQVTALQWRRMSPVQLSQKHLHLEVSGSGFNLLVKTHESTEPGVTELWADCSHGDEDTQL